ncbi:hypothetical protein AVEN_119485-1 [Araneus ventricosus]|uniref:Uncharacterized protein n=1 Tax=Araneus ventricosus TaxID=182803 RepID=A0A4Y2W7M4_ARAVE|nr:hypothetical protein AVEN_119485-1 [Araneus ventricosus]
MACSEIQKTVVASYIALISCHTLRNALAVFTSALKHNAVNTPVTPSVMNCCLASQAQQFPRPPPIHCAHAGIAFVPTQKAARNSSSARTASRRRGIVPGARRSTPAGPNATGPIESTASTARSVPRETGSSPTRGTATNSSNARMEFPTPKSARRGSSLTRPPYAAHSHRDHVVKHSLTL